MSLTRRSRIFEAQESLGRRMSCAIRHRWIFPQSRYKTILNLHAVVRRSRANGPGIRTVIWFQGCTLDCPDCFNPDTHSTEPRVVVTVDTLVASIATDQAHIEGITISGGEPLQQPHGLLSLLRGIRRRTTASVILFTGYAWATVQELPLTDEILAHVDVVISGPFVGNLRMPYGLRGSSNQTIHFMTGRYGADDLEETATAEIRIDADGTISVSGIDPPRFLG